MNRLFFLFFIFTSILYGEIKNLSGTYNIEYGFLGKLGTADTYINVDDKNNYKIYAKAYATGIAKLLSGNLVETYESQGKYIDGMFVPNSFKKTRTKRENIRVSEFIFDREEKKIINKIYKKEKKYKPLTDLNSKKEFSFVESNESRVLDFWSDEDILSLFFNIKHYIKDFKQGVQKELVAVGASEKRQGRIDIIVPKGKEYQKLAKMLKKDQNIFIVKIYKQIFASKNGELYMSVNDKGLCDKSILKDVLFFGDVVGTLE
jgi:hypothetical protein